MYFGKCCYTATYTDGDKSYLCLTQQMGGWILYDISNRFDSTSNEEEPKRTKFEELCRFDNRVASYTDNHGDNEGKGFAEFQQPVFFTSNNVLYLAIAGYDRDLCTIYDLSNPEKPQEVFGYHSGNNQCNIRSLAKNLSETQKTELKDKYLHTMGIAYRNNYLYCTIAPEPDAFDKKDDIHSFEGVAVIDVSDMNNINVSVFKMPDKDKCTIKTGEPSPSSIAVNSRHLIMDNAEKGISVWSLENPAKPNYLGCLNTGETVCNVYMTDDGRTFASNYNEGNITMFRGL